jgi:hypothetical protein
MRRKLTAPAYSPCQNVLLGRSEPNRRKPVEVTKP